MVSKHRISQVSLLVIAILGKVLLYILNPPNYISGAVLIRPFPVLLGLDIVNLVFGSIILVECIRIIADRSTSAWSLKRHFSLVLTFIIGHAIFYVLIISPAKSNYYYKTAGLYLKRKTINRRYSVLI